MLHVTSQVDSAVSISLYEKTYENYFHFSWRKQEMDLRPFPPLLCQ